MVKRARKRSGVTSKKRNVVARQMTMSCVRVARPGKRLGRPPLPGSGQSQQATADLGNPTIVDRRSNSRWSNPAITPPEDLSSQVGVELTPPANQMGAWSFFYRLIFDLVGCQARDQAAKVALESVLGQLKVGSGGVVPFSRGPLKRCPSGNSPPGWRIVSSTQ